MRGEFYPLERDGTVETKKLILAAALVFTAAVSGGHPDGSTPFWYPSTFIYGFINGCSEAIEVSRASITMKLWPSDIKAACACVVDSLRHSVEFHDASGKDESPEMNRITTTVFPVCIEQELRKKSSGTGASG